MRLNIFNHSPMISDRFYSIWYWPRETVPLSIQQATADSSISLFDWGSPSASYPSSSCTMENFFTPQQLVLDITLCGDWCVYLMSLDGLVTYYTT